VQRIAGLEDEDSEEEVFERRMGRARYFKELKIYLEI
jgi:hypothetical protein